MKHGAGTWAMGYEGLEAALWHCTLFFPIIVTILYGADDFQLPAPASRAKAVLAARDHSSCVQGKLEVPRN